MITCKMMKARYACEISDGAHSTVSDTTRKNGGNDLGFRPHDLLEAALGACINVTVRAYADNHGIPLEDMIVKVTLDRNKPDETGFLYNISFVGDLTKEQIGKLKMAARACPVHKTLSKTLVFSEVDVL